MMNLRKLYELNYTIPFEEVSKDLELSTHAQRNLIRLNLLEPPADGKFGPLSILAIRTFQAIVGIAEDGLGKKTSEALIETRDLPGRQLKLGPDFASAIARYYLDQGWYFSDRSDEINICYVEGTNTDGKPNNDAPNEWNDRRIIWRVKRGIPTITGNWQASCEPGWFYTHNPMNPEGCARIKNPAQFKAWRIGWHGGAKPHEALIQSAEVEVYRDRNKDMMRTGDPLRRGLYGINQHWGYGMQHVDRASAGCMTAPDWAGHQQFIRDCKGDKRYQLNPAYTFLTAFIPGDKLELTPN